MAEHFTGAEREACRGEAACPRSRGEFGPGQGWDEDAGLLVLPALPLQVISYPIMSHPVLCLPRYLGLCIIYR